MNGNGKKCILSFLAGNVSLYLFYKFRNMKKGVEDKNKKYCLLFDNWLILTERGDAIEQFFKTRNIKEIAVYGYGNIGRHLVTQLSNSDINIKYIIDKRKGGTMIDNIQCYRLSDRMPDVDAIVVTPICEYKEIKDILRKIVSVEIISLEDIVYELL